MTVAHMRPSAHPTVSRRLAIRTVLVCAAGSAAEAVHRYASALPHDAGLWVATAMPEAVYRLRQGPDVMVHEAGFRDPTRGLDQARPAGTALIGVDTAGRSDGPLLLACMVRALCPLPRTRPAVVQAEHRLAARELEVLQGMSDGMTNIQIGRRLYISEDTVKTHARRLFTKLGVHDRAGAVALGFRRGLLT